MKTIGDKIEASACHSPHAARRAPALARALTIGGSDSGGGAGIQADLKTFSAFRVYGMSVLTAVTAQNTVGVQGVETLSPAFITAQFESVVSDIGVDTLKTGMLGTAAVVVAVAAMIAKAGLTNLVVDPVMVAKSGDHLLAENAVHALRTRLLPLALVITPNLPEAEVLVGGPIRTLDEMREAARRLHALLEPVALRLLEHVHVLHADGAAVGLAERSDEFADGAAHRARGQAAEGFDTDGQVEVPLGEAELGELEQGIRAGRAT